jgi:hypothetical protein
MPIKEEMNPLLLMSSWSNPASRVSSTLDWATAFKVRLSLLLAAQSQSKRVVV